MSVTVFIPHSAENEGAARDVAQTAVHRGYSPVLAGSIQSYGAARCFVTDGSLIASLKVALEHIDTECLVLQWPTPTFDVAGWTRITAPLLRDEADVVVSRRAHIPLRDKLMERAIALLFGGRVLDVFSSLRAFRTDALRAVVPTMRDDAHVLELLAALTEHQYRWSDVRIDTSTEQISLQERVDTTAAIARLFTSAHEGKHEGHAALAQLEAAAPAYNTWLATEFAQFAGRRILEIGAGIGTITAQLAQRSEQVVAYEVEPLYVQRLKNRFRGAHNVEVIHGFYDLSDWQHLLTYNFDTIVLSNVLEHIADDGVALQKLHRVLAPGGKLILFVPAHPLLFGSLDQAVGHHRRYSKDGLRGVVEGAGFTVTTLKWMNLVGIPGWFVNGVVLGRRALPPVQTRVFDTVAPLLASVEAAVPLPVGLSLLCVAERP